MRRNPPLLLDQKRFDTLYATYHHRHYVHPDPLEFLYRYPRLRDREVVGLLASSLAYGRVQQILKSVSSLLERMGPSPYAFLMNAKQKNLLSSFSGFKHRFTTGAQLSGMLWGLRRIIRRHGSLYACFLEGLHDDHETILPALSSFVKALKGWGCQWGSFLLPDPDRGSACKRLNLFLRWMVREDEVDPGGWSSVPASKLIVPLDTHMHHIGRRLLITCRAQADLRSALEITHTFRNLSPEDPVRYDFVLTRLGIRGDMDMAAFLKECGARENA